MKRVLAILILLVSGAVITTMTIVPGQAFAEDEQVLVVPDVREDLIAESTGSPSDGHSGDPDSGTDGLGFTDQGDVLDSSSSSLEIVGLDYEDILCVLMSAIWLVP